MKKSFDSYSIFDYGNDEIIQELCSRLKALRRGCCMSQQDFARLSGVSIASVKRIESGDIKDFTMLSLIKILRAGGALGGLADLIPEIPESPFLVDPNSGRTRLNCRTKYRTTNKLS